MTLDGRTAHIVRLMLAGDVLSQFHRLWGVARVDGPYDKHAWADCSDAIADLLDACGLERRAFPRRLHDA